MITATTKQQQVTGGKRGRRRIAPDIRRFIKNEDYENKRRPPEERLPQRVLAHVIHEKLLTCYKGQKRVKIPKISTIQNELGKLPKEIERIDEPWDVQSLTEFPIPAEALPAVLRLWVAKRENTGRDLTIREAQWVARLYCVVKDMRHLAIFSSFYAQDERLAESSDVPLIRDKSLDLALFEAMTGEKIDSERAESILGHKEFDLIAFQRVLVGQNWHPLPQLPELVGIRGFFEDTGGQNERPHQTKRKT